MFSGAFQPIHWLLVILVAVVIFGPGKLGQLGANLGKSIRDFKDALNEKDVTPAPPPQPQNVQDPAAQAQNIQATAASVQQPAQSTVSQAVPPTAQTTAQPTVEPPRKDV